MSDIAVTPKPPYYAVIFSSKTADSLEGYENTADEMLTLAARQPGYLGVESARNDIGITVSYWRDEAAIMAWRRQIEHKEVRNKGKTTWYSSYTVRVCKVERQYSK
ncbi:MAG: antibiotic biosynthesis monooxygenase [Pseudomonadota bacterium]